MTELIQLTPRQIYYREYYRAKKSHIRELQRSYYEVNKEAAKDSQRAYREANKDRVKEKGRAWKAANKQYEAGKQRAWREANPEMVWNIAAKYRSGLIGEISPGWIAKLLELQRWTCIVCNKDLSYGYHKDHIVPIARGGENTDYNMQLLCPKCNLEKSDKDPIEFMQSRGFLL